MTVIRRDLSFGFDAARVRRDWCNGDPYITTFMNALSMLFPEGEKFFVNAVKQNQDAVTDPELRREIGGFIGQEAMHGREHRVFNDMLVAHGYDSAPEIERRLRKMLIGVKRGLDKKSQLAVTVALEHFTALLGEAVLKNEHMHGEVDESMHPLWLWHAFEETEHKSVAFDVYLAAGGGYLRRVLMMLLTTIGFLTVHTIVHMRFLKARGILFRPWRWIHGIRVIWIYPGFLTRVIPGYLQYFIPGFHPTDRDTSGLLESWRGRLFGTQGRLEPLTNSSGQREGIAATV
jgi:predicted metal-dependent hydrolase